MCKRDEVLPWTGLDEEPVGPFPAEPPFGSPEAVEQAAETIRATAKAQTPGEQQALDALMLVVDEVVGGALARVRRERDQSRLDHESSEATLAMAVARLGGEVEGRPTHRGNFLQRIDELRRQEGELLGEVERLRGDLRAMTVARDAAGLFMRDAEQQRDALADALISLRGSAATLRLGAHSLAEYDAQEALFLEADTLAAAALKLAGRLP